MLHGGSGGRRRYRSVIDVIIVLQGAFSLGMEFTLPLTLPLLLARDRRSRRPSSSTNEAVKVHRRSCSRSFGSLGGF